MTDKIKARPEVESGTGFETRVIRRPDQYQTLKGDATAPTPRNWKETVQPAYQRRQDYLTAKGAAAERVERVRVGKAIIKERGRPAGPKNVGLIRQREIELVITKRHGGTVPDPQDTEDRETCLAYARAVAFSMTGQGMAAWSAHWAPWMRDDEIEAIEWEAQQRSCALRADPVARLLNVTFEERQQYGLRTIGASDVSPSKRAELALERKQKRDRDRQDAKSRALGRKVRTSEAPKPWETEGISRRTWYRRKAWHSFIANKSLNTTGDNSVPNLVSLSSEKRKNESSSAPQSMRHPNDPPKILGACVEGKEEWVPRPQALVAEGPAPQGTKGSNDRTCETSGAVPVDPSAFGSWVRAAVADRSLHRAAFELLRAGLMTDADLRRFTA